MCKRRKSDCVRWVKRGSTATANLGLAPVEIEGNAKSALRSGAVTQVVPAESQTPTATLAV